MLHYSLGILNHAVKNKLKYQRIPYSDKVFTLIKILFSLGFISSYFVEYNIISVTLKSYNNNLSINHIFCLFKPSNTISISANKLRRICKQKNKLFILSTSFGICTSLDAIRLNIGGIILIEIS